jgi:hypothetical protein
VVEPSNDLEGDFSVTVQWKLCRVQVRWNGDKIYVQDSRLSSMFQEDQVPSEMDVETLRSQAYVVVSARQWQGKQRVRDDFVSAMGFLSLLGAKNDVLRCAQRIVMQGSTHDGGVAGSTLAGSGATAFDDDWSCVAGSQAAVCGYRMRDGEFFHTSWP